MLQQDLRCLLDPFVVKPALGHLLQQSDIRYHLLGVVKFTGDGHCNPLAPVLLDEFYLTLPSNKRRSRDK
jgi:hypothetical protein